LELDKTKNNYGDSQVLGEVAKASILAPQGSLVEKININPSARIWAIGGGKGGVGKSLISANFALSLAMRGKNVVAIDLDLGGANLHTCLGLEPPKIGLGDWISGRKHRLEELFVPTHHPKLRIIAGSSDSVAISGLHVERRKELAEAIRGMQADEIVLDLGAGTQDHTVEMFNLADHGIMSILPEPTSVENAYRFLKAVFFSRLQQADISAGIKEVIEAAMDQKNVLGIRTPADLFAIVERLDEVSAQKLKDAAHKLQPSIVINQVRTQVDIDVGRAICGVCRRYFGIEVKYAGYIDYDNNVWKAVRAKKSVLQEFPHSVLANRMEHLTSALLGEARGIFP